MAQNLLRAGSPQKCRWESRCNRPATCVGRLYVPPSSLSPNAAAEPVTAMLGLPLCDTHFKLLTAEQVLAGERGRQIKEAVELEFRKRNAYPNFAKAVIGRLDGRDADFHRFQEMDERARAN